MATEFCKKILALRKEKKLSQAYMAKALGCSVAFYSKVETGTRGPFTPQKIKLFVKAIKKQSLEKELLNFARCSQSSISIKTKNEPKEFVEFVLFVKEYIEQTKELDFLEFLNKICDVYLGEDYQT